MNNNNINYFNLDKDPIKVNTMFENISNQNKTEVKIVNKKTDDEKKKRKQEMK